MNFYKKYHNAVLLAGLLIFITGGFLVFFLEGPEKQDVLVTNDNCYLRNSHGESMGPNFLFDKKLKAYVITDDQEVNNLLFSRYECKRYELKCDDGKILTKEVQSGSYIDLPLKKIPVAIRDTSRYQEGSQYIYTPEDQEYIGYNVKKCYYIKDMIK